ncbi:MAG: Lipoprotein signal peptidase, partial [uncultured Gemmatimonadaceae bacterium]
GRARRGHEGDGGVLAVAVALPARHPGGVAAAHARLQPGRGVRAAPRAVLALDLHGAHGGRAVHPLAPLPGHRRARPAAHARAQPRVRRRRGEPHRPRALEPRRGRLHRHRHRRPPVADVQRRRHRREHRRLPARVGPLDGRPGDRARRRGRAAQRGLGRPPRGV